MSSPNQAGSHEREWWKEAVIYQIYPSSFFDSNGDGVGDIPGIIQRLPYIASLGVDCIWLSPHYMSPQEDIGYDISDYEDVSPQYGTLDDCQQLIDECHNHGMRIIFDLVINHTSIEHKWFQESRASKTNPKRNHFIWRSPRGHDQNGNPLTPNNWRSIFGGPAWEYDSTTQEYYLHLFNVGMPDLNWEVKEVRQAIYNTSMHFWLKRGIDGFRIDVVNKYSKPQDFADAPIIDDSQYEQPCSKICSNGPRMHEFLSEMYEVFSQYQAFGGGEIMTVGELPQTPNDEDVRAYVSAARKKLGMVFNFDTVQLGQLDRTAYQGIDRSEFKRTLGIWQSFVNRTDAWTTAFLENHDQGRSISRFGCDDTRELAVRSGKALAIILASMTGTLFLYQGQEIGMVNMPPSWGLEEYKDVWAKNVIRNLKEQGASPARMKQAVESLTKTARDHARTPMQWSADANGGFCDEKVTPWMRVHENYKTVNVDVEEQDAASLLDFWRDLIKWRKSEQDVSVYGIFEMVETDDELFEFIKTGERGMTTRTVVNMSKLNIPWSPKGGKLVISNMTRSEVDDEGEMLGAWEARIYDESLRLK